MGYPSNSQISLPSSEYDTSEYDNSAVITGLAAGTLVTTPDGEKKIEDVVARDEVLGGMGEGFLGCNAVKTAKNKHHHGSLFSVVAQDDNSKAELRFSATPHQVCFARSPEDEPNDELISLLAFSSFSKSMWESEHAIYTDGMPEWESNLDRAVEIAQQRSIANGGIEVEKFAVLGLGEHFKDCAYRFLFAKELEVGMKMPILVENSSFAGQATITNIIEEPYDGLVYALDVPQARNFAANGVLIHDSTEVQPQAR